MQEGEEGCREGEGCREEEEGCREGEEGCREGEERCREGVEYLLSSMVAVLGAHTHMPWHLKTCKSVIHAHLECTLQTIHTHTLTAHDSSSFRRGYECCSWWIFSPTHGLCEPLVKTAPTRMLSGGCVVWEGVDMGMYS